MSAAFVVVFALFVVAMLGLAVTAVRWGVRRDRLARHEAQQRQEAGTSAPPGTVTGPVRPIGPRRRGEAGSRPGDR